MPMHQVMVDDALIVFKLLRDSLNVPGLPAHAECWHGQCSTCKASVEQADKHTINGCIGVRCHQNASIRMTMAVHLLSQEGDDSHQQV